MTYSPMVWMNLVALVALIAGLRLGTSPRRGKLGILLASAGIVWLLAVSVGAFFLLLRIKMLWVIAAIVLGAVLLMLILRRCKLNTPHAAALTNALGGAATLLAGYAFYTRSVAYANQNLLSLLTPSREDLVVNAGPVFSVQGASLMTLIILAGAAVMTGSLVAYLRHESPAWMPPTPMHFVGHWVLVGILSFTAVVLGVMIVISPLMPGLMFLMVIAAVAATTIGVLGLDQTDMQYVDEAARASLSVVIIAIGVFLSGNLLVTLGGLSLGLSLRRLMQRIRPGAAMPA